MGLYRKIEGMIPGALLAASVSAAGATAATAASEELIAAAKEEGQVVWYTTLIIDQAVRPLVAAFEEKYPGIEVKFARAGSGETALKIINEGQAGNPQADVFDGTATYSSVGPAGLVESYVPETVAAYPDGVHSEDGQWHALNLYFLTAAYNTDLVSAEEAPKTYEDLLDPAWKDQMVWSVEPEPAAAPGFVGNILTHMGEEKGMEYLEALNEQNITNMVASQRAVIDRVILGDFKLGLMTFSHHSVISQGKGAPIEWIRMEPLVNAASLMGLVKDGPNPNAGKLFIDFMFSQEGQETLAEAGYIPSHPNVEAKVASLKPDGEHSFTYTAMTPEIVATKLPGWIEIAAEIFE
jgi:ABC-type Fe3+ transport system substrate-binding protein